LGELAGRRLIDPVAERRCGLVGRGGGLDLQRIEDPEGCLDAFLGDGPVGGRDHLILAVANTPDGEERMRGDDLLPRRTDRGVRRYADTLRPEVLERDRSRWWRTSVPARDVLLDIGETGRRARPDVSLTSIAESQEHDESGIVHLLHRLPEAIDLLVYRSLIDPRGVGHDREVFVRTGAGWDESRDGRRRR